MPYGSAQGAGRDGGEGKSVHEVVQEAKRFAFSSSSCVIPLRLFLGLATINPCTAWLQCPSICRLLYCLSHLTISQYSWLPFNSKPGNSKLYEFFKLQYFSLVQISVLFDEVWPGHSVFCQQLSDLTSPWNITLPSQNTTVELWKLILRAFLFLT